MFKDAIEVERAERDQGADSARIDAAIEAAEKAIAVLAARQLDLNETRKEQSRIRDRTILAIRNVRHNVIKRANAAKQTERWMVEKWLRAVNDGRIVRELTASLQNIPTGGLLDYLRSAIELGDLARIQGVNAVFAARVDKQRYTASFDKMLGQFTLSRCGTIGARIAKICELAEIVDEKIVHVLFAHCAMKGTMFLLSPPLCRIEGPGIGALDIETGLPAERPPTAPVPETPLDASTWADGRSGVAG